MTNPLDKNVLFEVIYEGEGLSGKKIIEIGAKQSYTYNLRFCPLRPFIGKGSITFANDDLGEIWYKLHLRANDSEPTRLPVLYAELGKTASIDKYLKNPSNVDTTIIPLITNPSNYDVYPETVLIKAHGSAKVTIVYTPSQLKVKESSEIIFESDDIGRWTFHI